MIAGGLAGWAGCVLLGCILAVVGISVWSWIDAIGKEHDDGRWV